MNKIKSMKRLKLYKLIQYREKPPPFWSPTIVLVIARTAKEAKTAANNALSSEQVIYPWSIKWYSRLDPLKENYVIEVDI